MNKGKLRQRYRGKTDDQQSVSTKNLKVREQSLIIETALPKSPTSHRERSRRKREAITKSSENWS